MVSLTDGQKATLSPEAAAYLTNIHHIPFASFLSPLLTSSSRVPGLRQNYQQRMTPFETELIEKRHLRTTDIVLAGVPVTVIEPQTLKPEKQHMALFNVFGGAFVMGSPRDRAALTMAAGLGVRVYSVGYTRAPEARYPVARDQCLAVYRELLRRGPPGVSTPLAPQNLYAMGCSSGAQLLVSMLLVARHEGLPMPAAGVYLCAPALDLSGAGDSMVANDNGRDLMPVSLLIGMVSQNYAPEKNGFDPRDPLYSPIYADDADYGSSFPPTIITVGTRDFALSHGVRFYWKLRRAGARVELLVSEGMWHGFNWDPAIPEALEVRAAVIEFLEGRGKSQN
jgi:monoterpene epsilon-lactone hydrolase